MTEQTVKTKNTVNFQKAAHKS